MKESFILKPFILQRNQRGALNDQDIKSLSMMELSGFWAVKTGFSSQHAMLKRKLVSAHKSVLLAVVCTASLSSNTTVTDIILATLPGHYWHN